MDVSLHLGFYEANPDLDSSPAQVHGAYVPMPFPPSAHFTFMRAISLKRRYDTDVCKDISDIGVVHLSWAGIFAGSNPGPDPLR